MLLAESFVLLALDPDGTPARGHTYQSSAAVGVTGALITELSQRGHLDLTDGRIHVTGTRPTDPLLQQVLDNVEPLEGKKLKSRLSSIKHSGWREVVDRMIDEGKLGREKETLHATRHPVQCVADQQEILDRVRAAATSDGPMDDETATLLALAGPCQLLEVVAPDRADRKIAKRRIKEAAERVPAADAVKYVIEAAMAAIAVGAVVASSSS
jgi:Golgi phosphoprotein 3 (GPP34)